MAAAFLAGAFLAAAFLAVAFLGESLSISISLTAAERRLAIRSEIFFAFESRSATRAADAFLASSRFAADLAIASACETTARFAGVPSVRISIIAIEELSPLRTPTLVMRVYPPSRCAKRGPISVNKWCTTLLSLITAITRRRAGRSPFLAALINFSATGRKRFAFVTVVRMRPC